MHFIDLALSGISERRAAAEILWNTFSALGNPTWTTLAAAEREVADCLQEEYFARAAVSEEGRVLAWGGLRPLYGNTTWELHPIVVDQPWRGAGIGGALLTHLEETAWAHGVTGIVLGSDDQTNSTTLSTLDTTIVAPVDAIRGIAQLPGRPPHPFSFYERHGYQVVGVIPDANGPGKPDILMWKRL